VIRRSAITLALLVSVARSAHGQIAPREQTAQPTTADPKSATYLAVVQGMSCKQQQSGEMTCEYKVGKALRFVIVGVGQADVSITFYKVDEEGDFVASIAPLNGCVRVMPHGENVSTTDFAFVSPHDGKVHRSWNACLKQPAKK